jgi:hypothetical protein
MVGRHIVGKAIRWGKVWRLLSRACGSPNMDIYMSKEKCVILFYVGTGARRMLLETIQTYAGKICIFCINISKLQHVMTARWNISHKWN